MSNITLAEAAGRFNNAGISGLAFHDILVGGRVRLYASKHGDDLRVDRIEEFLRQTIKASPSYPAIRIDAADNKITLFLQPVFREHRQLAAELTGQSGMTPSAMNWSISFTDVRVDLSTLNAVTEAAGFKLDPGR